MQIKRKTGEAIEITKKERKGWVEKSYDVLEGGRGKSFLTCLYIGSVPLIRRVLVFG